MRYQASLVQMQGVHPNGELFLAGGHVQANVFHGVYVVWPLIDYGYVMAGLGEQSRNGAAGSACANDCYLLLADNILLLPFVSGSSFRDIRRQLIV
tara:strand:- start:693 stop:980 length:288 start_codon:yes stop_codon:yes gene_type:complete